jgi:hypothetical protein
MTPAELAIENVERMMAGEITEPSEGTLAARVLAWAEERARRHIPIVTVSVMDSSR